MVKDHTVALTLITRHLHCCRRVEMLAAMATTKTRMVTVAMTTTKTAVAAAAAGGAAAAMTKMVATAMMGCIGNTQLKAPAEETAGVLLVVLGPFSEARRRM